MCKRCNAVVDRIAVPCADCGNDTSPTTGIAEYYMVNKDLWNSVAKQEILCIGCLEKRLGRTLTAWDFGGSGAFLVNSFLPISPRLGLRLGWRKGLDHDLQLNQAGMMAEEHSEHAIDDGSYTGDERLAVAARKKRW